MCPVNKKQFGRREGTITLGNVLPSPHSRLSISAIRLVLFDGLLGLTPFTSTRYLNDQLLNACTNMNAETGRFKYEKLLGTDNQMPFSGDF
jgi:hypothetical protein